MQLLRASVLASLNIGDSDAGAALDCDVLWERNSVQARAEVGAGRVPVPQQVLAKGGLKAVLVMLQHELEGRASGSIDWSSVLDALRTSSA